MVVVYCEMCGQRVPEEQLQAGSAVCFSDQRYYCKKCSSKLLELPRESPKSLTRTPKPGVLRAHTRALSKRRFDTNWILIGGAACALLFAVIAFNWKSAPKASTLADSTAVLQPASVSTPTTPLVSQINLAPQGTAALALTAAPAAPLDERERELLEMRQRRAMNLLDEARAEYKASPGDPWSYRDRLLILSSSYRNTPAADEAARLLSSLKMPDGPRPPPVPPAAIQPIAWSEDEPGWRPLLDGRSPPFLGGTWGFWKYHEGTLIAGGSVSNQTDFSFVDGDVRIRFQVNDTPYVEFTVRHGDARGYSVALDRRSLEQVWGRPLELLISCRADRVSATLNGYNLPVTAPAGRPRSGAIHICNAAGAIRLFSLDYRPPSAE